MGKVVDFPQKEENKEEAKMAPEDLKLLIEQNQFLKYCLRIMNHIPLGSYKDENGNVTEIKDEDLNYEELWNNVALKKRVDVGEVTGDAISFYFSLLSLGYDNFGVDFFIAMAESEDNAPFLYYAIKCFIEFMSDFTQEKQQEDENK